MEVMERAFELEAQGADVIHLEIGEPDHDPPPAVVEACRDALGAGATHYTDSRGLRELREAVAREKGRRAGVAIDPARVLMTGGTSPAMLLVFGLLVEPGSEVVIPTPHYPCYPNFVRYFGGQPVFVPSDAAWRIDVAAVAAAVNERTRALVVASPANPTGAIQSAETLAALAELGVPLVSDEIYDGLVFDCEAAPSALRVPNAAGCFVLDGFSKRYAMTGFRLGYVIAPPEAERPLQIAAQNLFISANEFVQRAGLVALTEGDATRRAMVDAYRRRCRRLSRGLRELGFAIPRLPDGAFYLFAQARRFGADSRALAAALLERAHVAVTPGIDFGAAGEGFLRFSLSAPDRDIDRALERLARVLPDLEAAA